MQFEFQLKCIILMLEKQKEEYQQYINEIFGNKEVVAILEKLVDNINSVIKVFEDYRKVLKNEKR